MVEVSSSAEAAGIDLEYWMTELPAPLKEIPLIYLAIPGSHDSMSYGITSSSDIAPDAPAVLRNLGPFFRNTVVRWTKTQQGDPTQQLIDGIRYFDLRIATKNNTDNLYFTHGLYAEEISGPLRQIKEFLDTHQNEVVILDCQHFYNFEVTDHRKLLTILVNTFGPRICPPRGDLETITLSYLYRSDYQVIIVYRHNAGAMTSRFWKAHHMPNPWPHTSSIRTLMNALSNATRPARVGYVTQAVVTPTTSFIILRWASSIKSACASPVLQQIVPWLSTLRPGRPTLASDTNNNSNGNLRLNVVIADFAYLEKNKFAQIIVDLNYKLLEGPRFP